MERFLLDTHILIWFLDEDTKLNKHIREGISYFQNDYFISIEALHEIITLQTAGKIDLELDLVQIAQILKNHNIKILPIELIHLKTLEHLSVPVINGKRHLDPSDRMMIAQAITEKLTFISSDKKFPYYKDKNFILLEN